MCFSARRRDTCLGRFSLDTAQKQKKKKKRFIASLICMQREVSKEADEIVEILFAGAHGKATIAILASISKCFDALHR